MPSSRGLSVWTVVWAPNPWPHVPVKPLPPLPVARKSKAGDKTKQSKKSKATGDKPKKRVKRADTSPAIIDQEPAPLLPAMIVEPPECKRAALDKSEPPTRV